MFLTNEILDSETIFVLRDMEACEVEDYLQDIDQEDMNVTTWLISIHHAYIDSNSFEIEYKQIFIQHDKLNKHMEK